MQTQYPFRREHFTDSKSFINLGGLATGSASGMFDIVLTGTAAAITDLSVASGDQTNMGGAVFTTGSTSTGFCGFATPFTVLNLGGGASTFEINGAISANPVVGDQYGLFLGWLDRNSATPQNGLYFRYRWNGTTTAGVLEAVAVTGSAETVAQIWSSTGPASTAINAQPFYPDTKLHRYRIEVGEFGKVNSADYGVEAKFYVDDKLCATIRSTSSTTGGSTNIPVNLTFTAPGAGGGDGTTTATNIPLGWGFGFLKTVGTTAITWSPVDLYMSKKKIVQG